MLLSVCLHQMPSTKDNNNEYRRGGVLILDTKQINTIEFIAKLLDDLTTDIRRAEHPVEVNPLLDHLHEEARKLKEIYNEFCWLETFN